ncbi:MAG: hypothetical protein IKZ28_06045 [Clostridia bacterium]|nr:hypothetical protein [Clostridia bacterium]
MKITDILSITELSRLLKKTRPTVYKYVSDFEGGRYENLPRSVKNLFEKIQSDEMSKKEIYEYCERWYAGESPSVFSLFTGKGKKEKTTVEEITSLIKTNEKRLDLNKLKEWIEKELEK